MMRIVPALRGPLAAVFVALFSTTAAADAVLHPGTVSGSVGVTGFSHYSGNVQISGNPSGYFGSTSFNGSTYSLTLEGAQSYSSTYVYLYYPQSSLSIWSNTPISVPANDNATLNLVRPGAQLDWHVDVAGGTLSQLNVSASGSSNGQGFSAYANSYGDADAHLIVLAGEAVSTHGSATIAVTDELNTVLCTVTRPLTSQTVELPEGQTVVLSDALVVNAAMCSSKIAGTVQMNNLPAADVWNYGYVYAYGPTYRNQYLSTNPSTYSLDGLQPGGYWVYAQLYYGAPYNGWLSLPHTNSYEDVAEGETNTHDFIVEGGAATGSITVSGSAANKATSAYTYYYGAWGTEAQNGNTQTYSAISSGGVGSYSMALTQGTWYAGSSYVYFSQPDGYAQLGVYDYSAPALTVTAGQTVGGPSLDVEATSGEIVFDVVEPAGSPVIGISSPYVNANRYDPETNRYYYLYASTWASNAATPSVKLIGPPGRYTFDAYATVNGSYTKFASSSIELGKSVNTPAGDDVVVTAKDSTGATLPIEIAFDNITTGGETAVSVTDQGPAAPADYDVLKVISDKSFLNITTSAQFDGEVQVTIDYDPTELDLTQAQEQSLELQQYVCDTQQSCTWEIITTGVDTAANQITGTTESFSLFAITLPNVVLAPPTGSCVGAANASAQLQTVAGVCSVTVDNTNQLAGGCEGGGGGLQSCSYDGAASQTLGLGESSIVILGTANDGSASSCTSYVSVVDREAPAVSCPAARTVECTGAVTAHSFAASCTENCGSCAATCGEGPFPLGATAVSCNAADGSGNAASCQTQVTVVDTSAPALSLTVSPANLPAPNHKLVPITLTHLATDGCDSAVSVACTAASNEPDNGLGDGDTANDVLWKNGALFLRAERSGQGTGRVYTIRCTATDASGNQTVQTATVKVAK